MRRQIAELVRDGLHREALTLYSHLHSSSSSLRNGFTFPALLKACAKLRAIPQAQMIHTHLIKTGFQSDIYAATALTHLYVKINSLGCALKVFDEIREPTIDSMNAFISGFSQNGYCGESFRTFGLLDSWNLRPDSVTIAGVLSGCESVIHGAQMHCWAVKIGVEMCVYVATSLLTMYSSSGDLVSATKLFGLVENKNVVCYNAYLTGLLQNDVSGTVLVVFQEMKRSSDEGPNSVTLVSVLSACAEIKNLKFGMQVHGSAVKTDEIHTMVATALVDMYSKCGSWQCAFAVFEELDSERSLVTWNSMIAGTMLNGRSENAVELFTQLESEGLRPDLATWNTMIIGFSQLGKAAEAVMFFRKMVSAGVKPSEKLMTSLLTACSALCLLGSGKQIHGYSIRTGCSTDAFLTTAVIDVYMKCGQVSLACRVFDEFEHKRDDPALWNVMISGYGTNNQSEAAFETFNRMLQEKVKPSLATFNCILSVCSHTGQTNKGWELFRMMTMDFGLTPTSKQLNILIDLLARSGQLDEARELLQKIPAPSAPVFASLLGAPECHSHPNLGEEMAQKLMELEPGSPIPLVILSNLYSGQGKWNEAERIRETINEKGLKKLPGYSLIGVA
ncbi:PREDICTED: pentatricopeptide repeat-containing protein At2g02750 [Ipomoea nil]|uniref:pentatricopeptide repeat-containing protein At2g02750 n=1 Tax=Ipomoea nil TaxID=35883 RepID=UPI000901D848|nr:PREDICTED: pentatricopeptide repeat-containing protein At2g02750 [Ipomoea nil]